MKYCKCGAPLLKNYNNCLICRRKIVTEQYRVEDSDVFQDLTRYQNPSVETESSGGGGDFGGGGASGDY